MFDYYLAVESTECDYSSLCYLLRKPWLNDSSATNTKSRHKLGSNRESNECLRIRLQLKTLLRYHGRHRGIIRIWTCIRLFDEEGRFVGESLSEEDKSGKDRKFSMTMCAIIADYHAMLHCRHSLNHVDAAR